MIDISGCSLKNTAGRRGGDQEIPADRRPHAFAGKLTLGQMRRNVSDGTRWGKTGEHSADGNAWRFAKWAGFPHLERKTMPVVQYSSIAKSRSGGGWRRLVIRSGIAAALATAAHLVVVAPSAAQDTRIINTGNMAQTGFSGTTIPGFEEGLPPGVDPVDETFIDPDSASLRIFDVSDLGGPASGQLVNTPAPFEVMARQIGQVFGLAYDDGIREETDEIIPNLYATATSLHGIQIVTDDQDADGRPERLRSGEAGARFMEGQFGEELGGGPGSIWKIDGQTGDVTLFANIEENSGPGLGNIAFDPRTRQFFVSDLDNGVIYRVGIDGTVLDSFDHGENGRPVRGLAAVSDDGAVMDIGGATFDSEDPESWGYTPIERRVSGVAVHRNRVYYASGEPLQIWSIGIAADGSFDSQARWELDVAADRDDAVTDIAFDRRGFMYLAQRGETENRYDYSRFAKSGKSQVLRYWRESPDDPATESIWVEAPQEYAVGFPDGHRQAAGGIDLQYGYDSAGRINIRACDATLFKSGDNLRDNPALADELAAGGPANVHGSQLTDIALVRPQNEPPFTAWYFDYDGFYEDPELKGHVGDVEVWRPCDGDPGFGSYIPYPGDDPVPEFPDPKNPCIEVEDIAYSCGPAGELYTDLYLRDTAGYGGDSIKAKSLTPGVGVSPLMQTRPTPDSPFLLDLTGTLPGDTVGLGLCFYKDADAQAGGYFPCCKVDLPIKTPDFTCN